MTKLRPSIQLSTKVRLKSLRNGIEGARRGGSLGILMILETRERQLMARLRSLCKCDHCRIVEVLRTTFPVRLLRGSKKGNGRRN
jgi:hypothetical protein